MECLDVLKLFKFKKKKKPTDGRNGALGKKHAQRQCCRPVFHPGSRGTEEVMLYLLRRIRGASGNECLWSLFCGF